MGIYEDVLNDEWNAGNGIFIEIFFMCDVNRKNIFAGLKRYILTTPTALYAKYIISCPKTHTLLAFLPYIENCSANEYKTKLVDILRNTYKLVRTEYKLTVEDADKDGLVDYFHFVQYAIWKNNYSHMEFIFRHQDYEFDNNGTPDKLTDTFVESHLNNTEYLDKFLNKYNDYVFELKETVKAFIHRRKQKKLTILQKRQEIRREKDKKDKSRVMRREKREKEEMEKIQQTEKDKKLQAFIPENCIYTGDKKDYITRKHLCELLDFDYNSQKDTRILSDRLLEIGVVYIRTRRVKGHNGVYIGLKLKET